MNGSPATIEPDSTVNVTAIANGTYGKYIVSAAQGHHQHRELPPGQQSHSPDHDNTEHEQRHSEYIPVTLRDTAVISNGFEETGAITFTLYLGSDSVYTESVPISGNGTYTTPTGYSLPATGTVTGTYQWNTSYAGDDNNTPASENNASAKRVMVSPASPTITTTPSVTAVTLGTSLVTLNDTAVLSGGYHETGTITFTLYLGSTLVDTESVPVSGNGTYTTPTGYTLPTRAQ